MIYPQSLSAFGQTKKAGITERPALPAPPPRKVASVIPALRAGEVLPYVKTKSPADAAANGQTSPADDRNKPGKRLIEHPCCFSNRASESRNVCNAKPIAPKPVRPACPPTRGRNAHRINYKWMIPQYLGVVNYIIPYLVFVKFFKTFLVG